MLSAAALTVCVMDEYPQKCIYKPGGNSLNFALGCRRYGWQKVSFIGAVGNDHEGEIIESLLKERGIIVKKLYKKEGHTARNKIYLSKAGERYSKPEDWQGGVYQDFRLTDEDWQYVFDHDLVATTFFDPNFYSLLGRRDGKNIMLCVDFLHSPDPGAIKSILEKVNLAFISCQKNEIEKYKALAKKNLLIFLLGKEGSIAMKGGQEFYQEAVPADRVVDTTGCGDAFQSAFACKWYETHNIQEALLAGAESARYALARIGGAF
jgi:sugar/nucleoside kinase (ribokinase family)